MKEVLTRLENYWPLLSLLVYCYPCCHAVEASGLRSAWIRLYVWLNFENAVL